MVVIMVMGTHPQREVVDIAVHTYAMAKKCESVKNSKPWNRKTKTLELFVNVLSRNGSTYT